MRRHVREFVRFSKEIGVSEVCVGHLGNGHLKISGLFRGRNVSVVLSSTPSCRNAWRAALRDLYRACGISKPSAPSDPKLRPSERRRRSRRSVGAGRRISSNSNDRKPSRLDSDPWAVLRALRTNPQGGAQ